MDQDSTRIRKLAQALDHAARAGLWQMANLAGTLCPDSKSDHLVIGPERPIYQQAIGPGHLHVYAMVHLRHARSIEETAPRMRVADHQADVVAGLRSAASR